MSICDIKSMKRFYPSMICEYESPCVLYALTIMLIPNYVDVACDKRSQTKLIAIFCGERSPMLCAYNTERLCVRVCAMWLNIV